MIKTLIVDDHLVLREGLKQVLALNSDISIVGETDNGLSAVELTRKLSPDLIILDINMPKLSGIDAAKQIREFNKVVKIIILTMHESESYVLDAVASGINGYISKNSDMDVILSAVRSVSDGKDYFPNSISNIIMSSYQNSNSKFEIPLTKREKEIISLIAKGLTSQEIADKLFISYFTVGKHRKNLMHKLQLKNTAELVHYAMKTGLTK